MDGDGKFVKLARGDEALGVGKKFGMPYDVGAEEAGVFDEAGVEVGNMSDAIEGTIPDT